LQPLSEVLVYATEPRAQAARALLGAACQATGIGARLDLYGTGSLYQRLGPRRSQPFPDILIWFGTVAASAAAADGLLRAHQPQQVPDGAAHDPNWLWTTLEYSAIRVLGSSPVAALQDVASVPRLALADPERSEVGMSLLLAVLDRFRQVEGDPERGWTWWQQRVQHGIAFAEDDGAALDLVGGNGVTHALTLSENATPLPGLAPIPHAIALAATSRNVDDARRLLDWMTSAAAGAMLRGSPWQAASNGLQTLIGAAPPLDVEWARQQYNNTRRRWAQTGYGPRPEA
jgi:ABC-type Fe3+ transport system substrate-binding protein